MSARPHKSLEPGYFEAKYGERLDYWNFEHSPYEAAKYQHTLSALPRSRYRRGFEIGCSIGVLTAQLARRCGELLSTDVSPRALGAARERCGALRHVELREMRFPREQPGGAPFDLVVVSEVGYYWNGAELREAQEALRRLMAPGGDLVLVHWIHPVSEYPLTGDEVHDSFLRQAGWRVLRSARAPDYRLEVLRLPGQASAGPDR